MISVIVPVYNQAEYLPDALESVLNQTPFVEIICVIDGATDASLAVAQQYSGVKVIQQVNKGLAAARNTGIMNAKGDWILPLDADDILFPHSLNVLHRAIDENPNADIIAPSFVEFGTRYREVILMPNPTLEDFRTGNRIGYFSAIRKSALLEVGGYNPKMIWGAEDYDLWFDLLKRGKKLVTLPDLLVKYRVKEESMWTETQKHTEEFMAQIQKNHPEL